MNKFFQKLFGFGICFILASVLAFMSSYIERTGPEMASYGNLCGATRHDSCNEPVLKGGFPFPDLFDAPGVSVEHQLSIGEDQLSEGALAADIAIYFALLLVLWRALSRRPAAERPGK
ncbi:MAG TPA: hypothetical protein VF663_12400 [Telluria sp.]|jgi:hypothetical protein